MAAKMFLILICVLFNLTSGFAATPFEAFQGDYEFVEDRTAYSQGQKHRDRSGVTFKIRSEEKEAYFGLFKKEKYVDGIEMDESVSEARGMNFSRFDRVENGAAWIEESTFRGHKHVVLEHLHDDLYQLEFCIFFMDEVYIVRKM